jgi:hypothetical protein
MVRRSNARDPPGDRSRRRELIEGDQEGQERSASPERRSRRDYARSRTRSPAVTRRGHSSEDTQRRPRIDPEPKQVSFTSPEGVDPKAPNKLLLDAAARNEARLAQANLDDERTLGEPKKRYCSSDPNCFLPEPIFGPDDTFGAPAWFMKEITIIATTPSPAPSKPSVRFDVSMEAAKHNATILRDHD